MRHLLEEAFNNLIESNSKKPVKESQLQEFLGFGAGDHEKEAANHKQKQNAFEDLAHHHQLSGDHEQAKQYKAAALAHGKAALAHGIAAKESNNSVLKRASSKAKAAAESASNEANSIKTPKPTEAAKRSALTHALRDHDRHGAKFTKRMDDLFNGAKPDQTDYDTHLPKPWN